MKIQLPPFSPLAINRASGNDFSASSISAFASSPEFQDLDAADVDCPAESLKAPLSEIKLHLLSNPK